jgi:hypothetical protein
MVKGRLVFFKRSLYSEGIEYLLVNGKVSIDQGKITGMRAGRGCFPERSLLFK